MWGIQWVATLGTRVDFFDGDNAIEVDVCHLPFDVAVRVTAVAEGNSGSVPEIVAIHASGDGEPE